MLHLLSLLRLSSVLGYMAQHPRLSLRRTLMLSVKEYYGKKFDIDTMSWVEDDTEPMKCLVEGIKKKFTIECKA